MRNRGIRRRRAKRNYVDFADLDELRPAMEHPLRTLHEIRSSTRRYDAEANQAPPFSWRSADPSAAG